MICKIYDNGGKTADRYTVVIGKDVYYVGAHPRDASAYAGRLGEIENYGQSKPTKISDFKGRGKRMTFNDLPEQTKRFILEKMEYEIREM